MNLSERMDAIFDVVAEIIFYVLPSLQFVLLFFTFESAAGGEIIFIIYSIIIH